MFWELTRKIHFFVKGSISPVNILSEISFSGNEIRLVAQWVKVLGDSPGPTEWKRGTPPSVGEKTQ